MCFDPYTIMCFCWTTKHRKLCLQIGQKSLRWKQVNGGRHIAQFFAFRACEFCSLGCAKTVKPLAAQTHLWQRLNPFWCLLPVNQLSIIRYEILPGFFFQFNVRVGAFTTCAGKSAYIFPSHYSSVASGAGRGGAEYRLYCHPLPFHRRP